MISIQRLIKNKLVKRTIGSILFIAYTLISLPALSAIPFRNAFEQYEMIQNETKELNLSLLANIEMMLQQNRINLEDYIPYTQLNNSDDSVTVSKKILKHSLEFWFEQNKGWNEDLVRTANNIDSFVSKEVADKNGNSVSFKFRPLQSRASIDYKGTVDASISYDVSDSELTLSVSKKIETQTYGYTITQLGGETINKVALAWNF